MEEGPMDKINENCDVSGICVPVVVTGSKFSMLIDTGASVSLMSVKSYSQIREDKKPR